MNSCSSLDVILATLPSLSLCMLHLCVCTNTNDIPNMHTFGMTFVQGSQCLQACSQRVQWLKWHQNWTEACRDGFQQATFGAKWWIRLLYILYGAQDLDLLTMSNLLLGAPCNSVAKNTHVVMHMVYIYNKTTWSCPTPSGVVHWSEVWTWLHRFNSQNEGLC